MIDEGILEDIDAHELDAYDRVDPRWRGQWWDPTNDYSIPADFGTAGFAVNRDVYQGPVDSWSVFFEPPAELQGKIASLSSPDEVIGAAQLYLGVEFCTEDADEMKKVLDLLVAQKPHVAAYTSDNIDNRSAAVMSARISGGTASKLRSGRVKMFLDGVIDTWTAYMVGDYADRPGYGGAPLFEPEAFKAICTAIDREGLQICVHAVGDGVVRLALDGYAAARRADGARDSRHRIEHIDTIHPEDVPRLAELGVASMQPVHVPGSAGLPPEPTTSLMGRARWPWAFAWRTLRDAGATIAFAIDWPISPLDPLHAIRCALTRRPWADDMPDQRLTLDECLAAYTRNGAFASFAEDRLGRLRPGFLADMVMVDGNLGSGDDAVVLTICDGQVTYRAM